VVADVTVGGGARRPTMVVADENVFSTADVLKAPGVVAEYLELADEQLHSVTRADARTIVMVAARVGATRLIDNVVLGEGVAGDVSVGVVSRDNDA